MGILTIYKNRKKVLGLNERSLNYIRRYNKKKAVEIADDKLLTKKVLNKAEIPTPALIATIENSAELESFNWDSLPPSFVMKPVQGLEGGGIEILYNRDKNGDWIKADRERVSIAKLKMKAKSILDGRFSLHNAPDRIMFEERIKPHKSFKYYTYKGTPDVRVIVFNNVPIMAMLRLPTRESEGKANLDKGALGLGIDMAKGATTYAISGKSGNIEMIPGTKLRVGGLKIPFWNQILENAIKAQKATNLNFAGIDFLIDRENGPVIVEMNARPGLSIQLANEDGMRWRLKKAAFLKVKTAEKGIRLAKDLFGGEIDEEIASISGKQVIGIYENIKLIGKDMKEVLAKAKIDTGADSSSIDIAVATKLGFGDLINEWAAIKIDQNISRDDWLKMEAELKAKYLNKFEDLVNLDYVRSSHGASIRIYVRITMQIQETKFETIASIYDRSKLTYPVIVGRKSLTRFLVDPSQRKSQK